MGSPGSGAARTYLVTGAAGFIGSHVATALLQRGDRVVGLDNLNDYYDPSRKEANLVELRSAGNGSDAFNFVKGDVRDDRLLLRIFEENFFDGILHLAAMAGVRSSIKDPPLYYEVNLSATISLLLRCVAADVSPNFVFASTSSVYGATKRVPFVESDPCDRPLVPYSASKRAAEIAGYSFHHLHEVDFTALRFFTVYGPRGRPDMMAYKVAESITTGIEVPLYNRGDMYRDWTFVDDVVAGVLSAADRRLGYEIINLGRGEPVLLAEFVSLLEESLGGKARLIDRPMPEGDVPQTHADISKARGLLEYRPTTSVQEGVARFVDWYRRNRDATSSYP